MMISGLESITPQPRFNTVNTKGAITDIANELLAKTQPMDAVTPAQPTAREQREKQDAFVDGAAQVLSTNMSPEWRRVKLGRIRQMAKARYPIPTRQEPRELAIDDLTFKVLDGQLYCTIRGLDRRDWFPSSVVRLEHVEQIAELKRNPTRTVEVDA